MVDAVTRFSPELLGPVSIAYAAKLALPDLAVSTAAIGVFLAACFAKPPPSKFQRMLVFNGVVPRAVQIGVVHISDDGLDAAFAKPSNMLVAFGAKTL